MTMTLNALIEGNGSCWRGEECELCGGVGLGLRAASAHVGVAADLVEQRVNGLILLRRELRVTDDWRGRCVRCRRRRWRH